MKDVKIAMLGGSFNPPHLGHIALAREVLALGYRKVVFVPAKIRPLKTMAAGASDADRLEMTRLAAAGGPEFAVDSCEMERDGPSYTCDTIDCLEKKYAGELDGKIALVVGDDLLAGFDEWHRSAELPHKADIVIARRLAGEGAPPVPPFPHIELDNRLVDISSSDIRGRIARGLAWEHLVGECVSRYIKQAKLYGYGTVRRSFGRAV
jgi:nicotinate-nucleotide adenylyltransferase